MYYRRNADNNIAYKERRQALLQRGAAHYKAERYYLALIAFQKAIRIDPECASAHVGKGDSLSKLGRNQEALDAYKQALTIDPGIVSAYNGIRYSYIKLGIYNDTFAAHEKAIQLDPWSAAAYDNKGQILRFQEKYEDALLAFEEAIELAIDTDNIADYYFHEGLVLSKLGRDLEALDAYYKAAQNDPENVEYGDEIFRISKKVQEMNLSGIGDVSIPYSQSKAEVYADEGHTLFKAKHFVEALRAYDSAIVLGTKDAQCYINLGSILVRYQHYEEAIRRFTQAIQLDSCCTSAYFEKGNIFVTLAQHDEALLAFDAAIQCDPDLAFVHVAKGHALLGLNRQEDALKSYKRAIDLHSNDALCYCNSGDIFSSLHAYEEALQMYQQAIQREPQLISAYLGLSSVLIKLKRSADAFIACVQAWLLDKKSVIAPQKMHDIVTLFHESDDDLGAYKKALGAMAWNEQTPDKIWRLATLLYSLKSSATIQFALFLLFITHAPLDRRIREAFKHLGTLYQELFDADKLPMHIFHENLDELRDLLFSIPEETRSNALALIGASQKTRIAQLLIHLAPFSIPGLSSLAHEVTLHWIPSTKNDSLAYRFYDVLDTYAVPDEDADWLYAQQLTIDGMHAQARPVLEGLVKAHPTLDRLWLMANTLMHCGAPAMEQIAMLWRFISEVDSADQRSAVAKARMSEFFSILFDKDTISSEQVKTNDDALQTFLMSLAEQDRARVLNLIANNGDIRMAQLLIHLAPFSVSGLSSLAREIVLRWIPAPRDDNLVYRLYEALNACDAYNVPDKDANWLYARQLMIDGRYAQATPVLEDLVKAHPMPECIWLLATAMKHCGAPAQEQIDVLRQFIAVDTITNEQRGEAWKRIGELTQGMAAIEAFQEAERCGYKIPQLAQYRAGEWDALPGLQLEPDYAYPTVVVLDLENDYQPDLPDVFDGSRVYEIAAVRMRGHTELETCHLVIKRDFPLPEKVAHLQDKAKEPKKAVKSLQEFIGSSILVGHNIEAFDAKHLRGMNVQIDDAQIIDTLTFARLLYPDSVHHHLGLLCHKHGITFQGEQHRSLPDARACAALLQALGDELIRRGGQLLAGFRAIVDRDSAFDQAILQPRGVPADPDIPWNLDPAPATPHILATPQETVASPGIVAALEQKTDALVERYDPSGAYVQHLPMHQRAAVLVETRSRLERMIAQVQENLDVFVLPDSHALLCPHRLRQSIEQAQDWQTKLALFSLYQASHNHDARTLYPLRLPDNDDAIKALRQILLSSCCASEWHHPENCSAKLAVQTAIENHRVILATHENYLCQPAQSKADIIIIDDVEQLQMHFAEYLAGRITSEQVWNWSPEAFRLLNTRIEQYVNDYVSDLGLQGRILLRQMVPFLTQLQGDESKTLLSRLRDLGQVGEEIASRLEQMCQQALQEETIERNLYAYWLEFRAIRQPDGKTLGVEQWSICGLNENLQQAFGQFFLSGYRQHIICGAAVSLGRGIDKPDTTFLTHFFRLPAMAFVADPRPPSSIYIPPAKDVRPASFLSRRTWAKSAGTFLNRLATNDYQSLVVSLHTLSVADAFIDAFSSREIRRQTQRQVFSPRRNWTTAKIAERMADPGRRTLAFISPRLRKTVLDGIVDIEATGPLRFLNQQDPLVAAHMRLYDRLYEREQKHPFDSYLLPQALLELKTRLSSLASIHIILDSGLRDKFYWEAVKALFEQDIILDTLPGMADTTPVENSIFSSALDRSLESKGLRLHVQVDDKMLYQTLRTFWQIDRFREAPLNQKEIVQAVLNSKDQLVIAATGGGKSLCYQVPAVLLAQESIPKVTLVISPLIALMNDQVAALRKNGVFSAISLNSTLSGPVRQHYLEGIKRGWYSLIYAAPEQIHFPALRAALQARDIGLIAIDEAHCVSQWGHNFRTEYLALKNWIETQLCADQPREFPIIALTATARNGYKDEQGTVQDIISGLGLRLQADRVRLTSPERPELEYSVEPITMCCLHCHSSLGAQAGIAICPACKQARNIDAAAVEEAKIKKLITLLADDSEHGLRRRWDRLHGQRQRGLIYCTYAKSQGHMNVEGVAEKLRADPRLAGLRVGAYHAQMPNRKALREVYSAFTSDDEDGLDIVVATNAFGMGIDVRRLDFVIHFNTPGTLEAYIQEAGRAGRDAEFRGGEPARCILLYHELDLDNQRSLSNLNKVTEQQIVNVYEALLKWKKVGEPEIFVTKEEIARLIGLKDKEDGKVNTALHYLAHHTLAHAKPVLVRGEDVPVSSLLAFEQGYQLRLSRDMAPLQRRLIQIFFRNSEQFRLREQQVCLVDIQSLAEDIGEDRRTLSDAIKNLVGKHILAYAQHLSICWLKSKAQSFELVTHIEQDIITMLQNVQDQQGLRSGKAVKSDLEMLDRAGKRLATDLPLPVFADFLSELAKSDFLQLFEHFKKRSPGCYQLQLKSYDPSFTTCRDICERLRQIIQRYDAPESVGKDWQVVDMLTKEADPMQRSQSGQLLRLLEKLQILSLASTEASTDKNENAMRIIFQQDDIAPDQLTIDLKRLHLVERHNERKLELMREYATMSSRQERLSLVKRYFAGEMPLLEPFMMRSDLTEQQQAIVSISGGYHLIEGPAGSGKTTILEEHIRYLIEHELVSPDRILVVTHFNSAVDRIVNNVNGYQRNGKTIRARTLNSLAMSIFSQNRQLLLRPDGQPYYADVTKLEAIQGNWPEIDDKECRFLQEVLTDMRKQNLHTNWSRSNMAKVCLNAIKILRENGIFPPRPIDDHTRRLLPTQEDQKWVEFLRDVHFRYLLFLGENGWYTYDDQILFALVILQARPDIARGYQWLYEHIVIDEFQDLTDTELQLVGILSQKYKNVMAFGDDVQDIRVKAEQDNRPASMKKVQRIPDSIELGDLDDHSF